MRAFAAMLEANSCDSADLYAYAQSIRTNGESFGGGSPLGHGDD